MLEQTEEGVGELRIVGESPFSPASVEDKEVWLLVGVMGRGVEEKGGVSGMDGRERVKRGHMTVR